MDCVVARALRGGTLDQAGAGREGMRLSAIRELGEVFARALGCARAGLLDDASHASGDSAAVRTTF